jgi:tripeptidyl-peptidase I
MAESKVRRLIGLIPFLCLQSFAAVTVERIGNVPNGWSLSSTPSASTQITLQVALSMQNLDQLESKLAAASTPNSPTYGQYLDLDGVNDLFGPSDESRAAVESWLQSSGVTNYKTTGNSIWFKTDVSTANTMLGTSFNYYSDNTGATKLRTTAYSVPESIAEHVDLISPTTYFGKSRAMAALRTEAKRGLQPEKVERLARRQVPSVCNGTIVFQGETFNIFQPECLRIEYNVNDYTPDVSAGSTIAFGSFLNQSASFSDLTLYEQAYGIPIENFTVILVNPEDGATDQPQPPSDADDGEANLDVQNIVGLTHPMPVYEFITAGSPPYYPDPTEPAGTPNENEPYLPYYEFLLAQSDLPQVITNSYGDDEQTVPQSYAVRVCNLIGILGLRGISVLHSAGDEGVGAGCLGNLASNDTVPQFNPVFPVCNNVTTNRFYF